MNGSISAIVARTPKIPGADLAGTVATDGKRFKAGDPVYGIVSALAGGALAQYCAVPESQLAPVPAGTTLEDAASLPLAGLTALQALNAAKVAAGDRLLFTAGSGGVGSLGVQLAAARGAAVTSTAGPANLDFVRGLGADTVVNYRDTNLVDACAGAPFDAAVDVMGGATEDAALAVVKPSGRFCSIINSGTTLGRILKGKARALLKRGPAYTALWLSIANAGATLETVFNPLLASGALTPCVASVRPLADGAAAFDELAAGHVRGKLVLAPPE